MPDMDLSLIGDFFSVIKNMMVMSDAPHHTKRRATAARGFDQNLLESYRPLIEKTVHDLLEPLRVEGTCEFVQEVAMHLPATILADLFEIPSPIRKDFYQWSNTMTKFFGGASDYQNKDGVEVNDAAQNMRILFEGLIKERREKPKKDFLSIMLMMQKKMGLTDGEVISQAVMMLVAGTITTTDQICNNTYTLLTEPGLWQKVRSRPDLLATTIEELNRWDPGVSYLFRVAKRNTTIGETAIREGDVIFISNHAVNRDPSQFQNPNSIEPERRKNPHFAYGHGAHYCLGAPLARMQMNILFDALLGEFPGLGLDPERPCERNHYSLAFSGFKSIHLKT
jgi:cytochrome P450